MSHEQHDTRPGQSGTRKHRGKEENVATKHIIGVLLLLVLCCIGVLAIPGPSTNASSNSLDFARARVSSQLELDLRQSEGESNQLSGTSVVADTTVGSGYKGNDATPKPREAQPAARRGSPPPHPKTEGPDIKSAAVLAAKLDQEGYKKLWLPPEPDGSPTLQWKWDIGNQVIADWGGGELGNIAAAVAYAESSYNCGNTTGDHGRSWGLFQINLAHKGRWTSKGWIRNDLKDCWKNQTIAKEIYHDQGFSPWGAYTHPRRSPRYLQFLK